MSNRWYSHFTTLFLDRAWIILDEHVSESLLWKWIQEMISFRIFIIANDEREFPREKQKLTASSSTRTVSIMGIIMAVAAVFEIHIEMNIVTKNKPNVSLRNKKLRKKFNS